MKKSENKTEFLLLKATNNDEFTNCSHCIVKITENEINNYKKVIHNINPIVYKLNYLSFYFENLWFIDFNEDETSEWLHNYDNGGNPTDNWCYIDLSEIEIEKLLTGIAFMEGMEIIDTEGSFIQVHAPGGYFKFMSYMDNIEFFSYDLEIKGQLYEEIRQSTVRKTNVNVEINDNTILTFDENSGELIKK